MILELPNYVSKEDVAFICNSVKPFLSNSTFNAYNRDGKSVFITKTPELKEVDNFISKIMIDLQQNVVSNRFNPSFASSDSGYEYHLYEPNDICYYHTDGEVSNGLLRYATVIIYLSNNDDGEIIFPSQNKEIKPSVGKVVVFPPHGTHGHYSKPSKTKREILITWFVYAGIQVTGTN